MSEALLERERELDDLTRALGAARRGQGSMTVIAGPAGGGKSSLLAAALESARRRRMTICRGRGSELEQELAFGVIRQLLEPLLRSRSESERDRLLTGAAALAAPVFEEPSRGRDAAGDDGFATLDGLYWLTAGLAAGGPILLAVDDAHWSDPASLRALSYLAGRIGDLPVAMLVTLRPYERTGVSELLDLLSSQAGVLSLQLRPLGRAAVAMLVRAEHPDAGEELCEAFHQASGGNPFYLRELLRSLGAWAGGTPTAAAVHDAALAGVADRVLKATGRLGRGARDLAAAMAVLGLSGRLHHAAAVARTEIGAAAQAALDMRRMEILAGEDPFEWIHPLVQRSIYDSLTLAQRDALHARAADVLEGAGAPPAVVAAHLSAASATGSTRVVERLLAAAEDALSRNAPEVAVTLLRRAVDEQAPEPPRSTLLLRLGQVEVTRRDPGAAQVLEEARQLTEDPHERVRAALALAESYTFAGEPDAAARVVGEALADRPRLDEQMSLELDLAHALLRAFDPDLAPSFRRDWPRLRGLARGGTWPARALAAALAMTATLQGEHLQEVLPLCEHAIADDVLISQRGAGAFASGHVLLALGNVDEGARALAFMERLEAEARAQGSFANVLLGSALRGWILVRDGRLLEAEEMVRPAIDAAAERGALLVLVNLMFLLTDLMIERPAHTELTMLVESIELPDSFARAAGGAWVRYARGRLRALRGAGAAAAADLSASGAVFEQLGFGPVPEPWRSALALVLPPEDDERARYLVEEELRLARRTRLARPYGISLRATGLLTTGDEGLELLRESVRVLADSPARYEHAHSLVELGAALRRTGRRAEAREPLRTGMELAHRGGAQRLVQHAREELLATGARPRRIARSGFDALTASERRIVRLAAEGHSNPEIAQLLYVSVKTVETHLSSAYAKVELSGAGARRSLVRLVQQAGASPA